jgi:hypothetical protein
MRPLRAARGLLPLLSGSVGCARIRDVSTLLVLVEIGAEPMGARSMPCARTRVVSTLLAGEEIDALRTGLLNDLILNARTLVDASPKRDQGAFA